MLLTSYKQLTVECVRRLGESFVTHCLLAQYLAQLICQLLVHCHWCCKQSFCCCLSDFLHDLNAPDENWKLQDDASCMYQHQPKAPVAAVVLGPTTRRYHRCYDTHAAATVQYGFLAARSLPTGTGITYQHKALAVVKVLGPLHSTCSTTLLSVASLREA